MLSEQEYVFKEMQWRQEGDFTLLTIKPATLNQFYQIDTIISDSTKRYNYLAKVRFEKTDTVMFYPIKLPFYFKEYTIDSVFYRVFYPKDLTAQTKEFGIYAENKKSCIDEVNCWQRLAMQVEKNTMRQRATIVEVLKSVRMKKEDKEHRTTLR